MESPLSTSLASAPPCLAAPADERISSPATHTVAEREARWFREEIAAHEPDLRRYLRSRFSTLPDTDDILQETYAKLFRLRQGGPVPITRAFLFVVARNLALDQVRRARVVPLESFNLLSPSSVVEDSANAATQLCHAEELELLDQSIETLPPRCRDVMVLRRQYGLSHEEIAHRLGIGKASVHTQLDLGFKRCRAFLSARGLTCSSHVRPS